MNVFLRNLLPYGISLMRFHNVLNALLLLQDYDMQRLRQKLLEKNFFLVLTFLSLINLLEQVELLVNNMQMLLYDIQDLNKLNKGLNK